MHSILSILYPALWLQFPFPFFIHLLCLTIAQVGYHSFIYSGVFSYFVLFHEMPLRDGDLCAKVVFLVRLERQSFDFFLQVFQEAGGVRAVHLRVVELERNSQGPFPKVPLVFAPNQEGVVEPAAIHADGSVYFILGEGGRANNHAVGQVMVLATSGHLSRQPQVIVVELPQVFGEGDVARTHFSFAVGHDGADCKRVVPHQLFPDGQRVELFYSACCPSDAPAHQHIELQTAALARPDEPTHVDCPEKGDHGHGGVHPHFEGVGTRCFFGGYFNHIMFCFLCMIRAKVALPAGCG